MCMSLAGCARADGVEEVEKEVTFVAGHKSHSHK